MPRRLTICLKMAGLLWVAKSIAIATSYGADLRSLGLENAWTTQAKVSSDGRGVISAELWLDSTQQLEFAIVELSDTTLRIAANQLGPDLKPLGMEGARAAVNAQAVRLLGKADGFEVTEKAIGQLRLIVTNSEGLVQCFDAETGRLQWATPCGDYGAPTYPAALSEAGVVLVRGDRVYLLDWLSGKQLAEKRLPSSTGVAAAALEVGDSERGKDNAEEVASNSVAFVVDLTGLVSGYSLNDTLPPWTSRIVGRNVVAPVSLPDRSAVAIATDKGWLYVISGVGSPKVQFRYESGSRITGSLAAGDDAFYVGDVSGNFSKISTRQQGNLEWNHRLPQSISAKPLIDFSNGIVFVSTEAGELTAIEDSTGFPAWSPSTDTGTRVRAPLAVCNGSVICRTNADSLVAFDAKSGQVLNQSSSLPLSDLIVTNSMTDRLYLLELDGRLKCYHPIGRTLPRIAAVYEGQSKANVEDTQTEGSSAVNPGSQANQELDTMESDSGSDPFATETAQPGTEESDGDPFAEGTP